MVKPNQLALALSHSKPVAALTNLFKEASDRDENRKRFLKRDKSDLCKSDEREREKEGNRTVGELGQEDMLPVLSTGSSQFIPPSTLAQGGEGREWLYYHKKAAAFIETCYWRAKITLNNNNPPPWKPIKCRQQTLGLPTALLEATEVGLNDTW